MPSKLAEDPRIDPRIKAIFGAMPDLSPPSDAATREELLAQENSPEALAQAANWKVMGDAIDNETVAPSAGLCVRTEQLVSAPDGNMINIQFIRPDTDERLPCVYYIHGGGMAMGSCFDGMYRAWGKIIAAQGVAVAMVASTDTSRVGGGTACGPAGPPASGGYQLVAGDGGVFSFGEAGFAGSLTGAGITDVVGLADS